MAVVDADIIVHGSAVMPTDDTTTQIGGNIDLSVELVFTDIDPAGTVEALSDGTDTRTLTIYYYDNAGILANEAKVLTSGTPVAFVATMAAILRATLSATDASRTVTVRKSGGGSTLMTIKPNRDDMRRPFYNAVSNPTGGATKKYYEKVCIKNTNGTSDLTSAQIVEAADPNNVVAFALEGSLDGTGDNGVGNNRQVAPAGLTFDSTTKSVPTGTFTHAKFVACWLELTLVAGAGPADTTFTLRVTGVAA